MAKGTIPRAEAAAAQSGQNYGEEKRKNWTEKDKVYNLNQNVNVCVIISSGCGTVGNFNILPTVLKRRECPNKKWRGGDMGLVIKTIF